MFPVFTGQLGSVFAVPKQRSGSAKPPSLSEQPAPGSLASKVHYVFNIWPLLFVLQ